MCLRFCYDNLAYAYGLYSYESLTMIPVYVTIISDELDLESKRRVEVMLQTCKVNSLISLLSAKVDSKHAYYR